MKEINVIGLDLAKNIFQVYGVNRKGERTANRKLSRKQMLSYFSNLPPCLIGIEACGNSHYWARELIGLKHQVKMMNPKFVKPYLKGNKNDYNDAEAICEAVQRPNMRFVELKTTEQQSVLHLHKSRQLLVKARVGLSNHIRALLSEFGLILAQGVKVFEHETPVLITDECNGLPPLSRQTLWTMWESYQQHKRQIVELEKELTIWHKDNEDSSRLAEVPGIGVHTATALVGKLGNGRTFRNGREVAAFVGLVPKQASSGGKEKLLGISKRGDGYLRRLLVQGAKSVIRHVRRRLLAGLPGGNPWVESLLERKHPNKVAIALANKMARIAWVILAREEHYRQATMN